jgi:hypothetical protein
MSDYNIFDEICKKKTFLKKKIMMCSECNILERENRKLTCVLGGLGQYLCMQSKKITV